MPKHVIDSFPQAKHRGGEEDLEVKTFSLFNNLNFFYSLENNITKC